MWLIIVHRYLASEVARAEGLASEDAIAEERVLETGEALPGDLELPTPAGGR